MIAFYRAGAVHTELFRQPQTSLIQSKKKKKKSSPRVALTQRHGKGRRKRGIHSLHPSPSPVLTAHNRAKPNGFAGMSCGLPSLGLCSHCLLCLSCNPPIVGSPKCPSSSTVSVIGKKFLPCLDELQEHFLSSGTFHIITCTYLSPLLDCRFLEDRALSYFMLVLPIGTCTEYNT